jgi:hypothetical protein
MTSLLHTVLADRGYPTVTHLSRALGIHPSLLRHVLAGRQSMSARVTRSVARVLRVSEDEARALFGAGGRS